MGKREFFYYKNTALELVKSRISYFNVFYNLKINKISVKNQKTRWGSCSKKGNLNFNYRVALLPPHLADYVIVHELCHLGEFNHSVNFWKLLSKTIPDYKKIKSQFKKIRIR
ncbi:MAG: hypothetical protein A3C06_00680 [Candidatus Taylorbacteria bacterium RIFCSPHIGHO2_02_FULL_46_13]|uniref:YgjP-like metallopeptidase domain-containing protein n=2 Tax=Parcubacteria group TaxID=1794811 RepID=A0A1G2HST1_9BACT|nr:MAG: hypothetical protein A2822_03620 [Candidatus Staskawiczbacteria bacterium RIFCSPHIGHO2_01_FULL_41_41]OGZ75034.1 MAG: hypothetical protein A3A12_04400 [Candidatus Staskawiczbacteria bacterium RIFCSPLOWO2_01_FULL_43_17b]OHA26055.1 MAG: hypothetical protein A3C06_00680 [Candidatus Taylorbacteria bacterium RIFCSPHIGHO2_02_FULL_46_13]